MIKSVEATGTTIDLAIQAALAQLGLERDDVTVEVLDKPRSGFLGFGASPARVRVSCEESPEGKAVDFVQGVLNRLGVQAKIESKFDEEAHLISLEISGEDMGVVIGRRGDTLDAIQYLSSLAVNKDEDVRYRVVIDTENYRAKREGSLIALAKKIAGKAVKYRRPLTLEPMNPYERRIIHAALQDYAGVSTYSTGSEPNRRVVVAPVGVKGQGGRSGKGSERRHSGSGQSASRSSKPHTAHEPTIPEEAE